MSAGRAAAQAQREVANYGREAGRAVISAKQMAAATRGLPAQFTDIVTSLAAGQNPLQVFLQQGGQIKDQFGGAGNAVRALQGYVASLINPMTIAAGLAGVMAVAFDQAQGRAAQVAIALLETGNRARTTADEVEAIAARLDDLPGVTRGAAVDAISEIIRSTRIAGDQLEEVTAAALAWQRATGASVEETAKSFEALNRNPIQALEELGDKYGFATDAQRKYVRELQEGGRYQDAATEAVRIFSDTISQRSPEIVQQFELTRSALKGIKEAGTEAWDAVVTGLADADKAAKQTIGTIERFWNAMRMGGVGGVWSMQASTAAPAVLPRLPVAQSREAAEAARRAKEEFESAQKQFLPLSKQMEQDIAAMRKRGLAAQKSAAEIKAAEDQIRKTYADREERANRRGAGAARALDNASARAAIQAIKDDLAEEQASIQSSSRILQAEFSARLVTIEDYYKKQSDLLAQGTRTQEEAIQKQIAFLKQRDVAGRDSVDTQREIGELEAKLARVRQDGATAVKLLGIEEAETLRRRNDSIESYRAALALQTLAEQRQQDAAVARVRLGEEQFQQQQKIISLYQEEADKLRDLATQRAQRAIDETQYKKMVELQRQATADQVRIVQDGYSAMKAAQAEWTNGVAAGVIDITSRMSDLAGQVEQATTSVFDRLTDDLADFVTSGKFSFKEFADSAVKELARIVIKQQAAGLLQRFLPSVTGSAGNAGNALSIGFASMFGNNTGWLSGFSSGGYTGDGGKYDPAGVVHKGEYVLNADTTRLLGRGYLDRLNSGQAPTAPPAPSSNNFQLNQTFVVQGTPDSRTREQMARDSGREARRGMARTGG